jgi:hypothetical protein
MIRKLISRWCSNDGTELLTKVEPDRWVIHPATVNIKTLRELYVAIEDAINYEGSQSQLEDKP